MRNFLLAVTILAAPPALAQGIPGLGGRSIPGLGSIPSLGGQPETPEQKQEFCRRVAGVAARCGVQGGFSIDMAGMTSCLMQNLPPQDSLRVAQVANSARGSAGALLSECGIGGR